MSFVVPSEPEIPSPVAVVPGMEIPDLLDDLPPFEQEAVEIQGLLRAVGNELARIEAMRQATILGWFPATSEEMLHLFEFELGLPTDPIGLSLVQRQQIVLSAFRSLRSGGAGSEWEAAINGLLGGTWHYAEHDPDDGGSPAENTLLISLPTSPPQTPPTGLAAVGSSTGTLTAGTYFYQVAAVTKFGTTVPTIPVSVTVTSGKQVTVSWDAQGFPTEGYQVFRGTTATNATLIHLVGTNSYVDTGADTPGIQTPATMDTSGTTLGGLAVSLIERITPAHLEVDFTFGVGWLVGVAEVGVDTL